MALGTPADLSNAVCFSTPTSSPISSVMTHAQPVTSGIWWGSRDISPWLQWRSSISGFSCVRSQKRTGNVLFEYIAEHIPIPYDDKLAWTWTELSANCRKAGRTIAMEDSKDRRWSAKLFIFYIDVSHRVLCA